MGAHVTASGERLQIAGEMTIYTAARLYQELLQTLRQHPAARRLDLAAVTEIDTAGLQILLMSKRCTPSGEPGLQWESPSAAVSATLELLQLAPPAGEAVPREAQP